MNSLRRATVVYVAAALQGFAFTLVPALATVFADAPYTISPQAFGQLFITLTAGAIVAAVSAAFLARRVGTFGVLRLGVAANVLGLVALVASSAIHGSGAYALLLIDTTALGLGFGLNFSAVNELASTLGTNETRSVTVANVLTGLGTALTPLLLAALIAHGVWIAWPIVLIVLFCAVVAASIGLRQAKLPTETAEPRKPGAGMRTLALFGVTALLYALCEGTFSSWTTTFAHGERHLSLAIGEAALAGFWLALTAARILGALTARVLRPRPALVVFPLAIAAALLLLPLPQSDGWFIAAFVFAGVACSVVFPYAMSLALAALPSLGDRVAGVLVGALMTGEGIGTFAIGALHAHGMPLATIYRWSSLVALALAIAAALAVRSSPASAVKTSR